VAGSDGRSLVCVVIFGRQREGSFRFSSTIGPRHDRSINSTDGQAAPLCPTIQSQPALPARDLACVWVAAWSPGWPRRLSHSRKSSSTIANCEPLVGSTCSSLMMWSSPDLSASRTTTAAFSPLALRRWRTSVMAFPNDSNEGVGSTALSFDGRDGRT